MFLLGVNLPERRLVKIALTNYVGIGHHTSRQICARLSFHDRLTVGELTEHQVSRLAAFLAAPSTAPALASPIAPFSGITAPSAVDPDTGAAKTLKAEEDPLQKLLIENDLRREVQANILHHRTVGSYKGRRHAMGFPVRGQRTHTNAQTAKRLNTIERRAFSTAAVDGWMANSRGPLPCRSARPTTSAILHALDRRRPFDRQT